MELYNKILEYFLTKGCQRLQVNASGMDVFYQTNLEQCTVYWLIEIYNGTEILNDQYQNIKRQIETAFFSKGYQKVLVYAILCTKNTEEALKICRMSESACIVDMLQYRLMLFEGQARDENGVFRGLEQLISEYGRLYFATHGGQDYSSQNTDSQGNNENSWGGYGSDYENQRSQGTHQQGSYQQGYGDYQSGKAYQRKNGFFSGVGIVTLVLIALNAVVFFYTDLSGNYNKIISEGCIFWPLIKFNNEYYRLLTYQFLHANISHLVNNMLILAIMGSTLERHVGKFKYLLIYFLSGIVAGIASMSYNMWKGLFSNSIGASGAVFGVIGAIALIVVVNKGRLETIGTRQIIIFIALSLYGGFTSQGVDNAAHVGGLLAGFFIAMLVYRKKRGRIRED
ncbi:rhomboid family intramembrane serine protease [Lachnoclostridium phytofermentans]|uniref:Rhomboid family protein n=1 Tax=Lachnoclostridium phytofermentans (strain ATCC 700394 / DSM 18823 / ISDg) TaxID=357809 RepID=A9KQC3_LACP7|nr:rhomboid family intramembrane serine protease [Lachnoclostridium phytofermentans]ABX40432.1 Rhomboid family protein [Lachnoclostridium phytofermentans ISDg]